MQGRLALTIERLSERHRGQVIVVVSHADPIKVAISDALGVPLDLMQRTVISPCSVSVVSYGVSAPSVLAVNSTGDLANLGIAKKEPEPKAKTRRVSRCCKRAQGRSTPPPLTELRDERVLRARPAGEGDRRYGRASWPAHFLHSGPRRRHARDPEGRKQQVGALAAHLGELLQDLARPGELVPEESLELEAFEEPDFTVGSIALAYDAAIDRVVILAEERVREGEGEGDSDEARLALTREQAGALAIRGTRLVEAGRPPCPLCGFPLDPRGHACPRTNGHHAPLT